MSQDFLNEVAFGEELRKRLAMPREEYSWRDVLNYIESMQPTDTPEFVKSQRHELCAIRNAQEVVNSQTESR
jgi:hypothetical protein